MGQRGPMISIFLDANFLLLPTQFKLDMYQEFERLVPKPWQLLIIQAVFTELEEKMAKLSPTAKFRHEYRFARQLLERHPFVVLPISRKKGADGHYDTKVDHLLLTTAEQWQREQHPGDRIYVATNDKKLRGQCRQRGIATIYLRNKKHLDVDL